jgi:hypothetical protein
MKMYLNVLLQLSRQLNTANLSELLTLSTHFHYVMRDLAVNIECIGNMLMNGG